MSNGGAAFFAGKSINNKEPKEQASIAGAVAMALHVRQMAKFYGIPVVLHSDHCAKKLLPWFDGMLDADEEYFQKNGEPLFSSHMLDLSEEVDEENISTCKSYLERMATMKVKRERGLWNRVPPVVALAAMIYKNIRMQITGPILQVECYGELLL